MVHAKFYQHNFSQNMLSVVILLWLNSRTIREEQQVLSLTNQRSTYSLLYSLPSTMTLMSPESSPCAFLAQMVYFPVSPRTADGMCMIALSSPDLGSSPVVCLTYTITYLTTDFKLFMRTQPYNTVFASCPFQLLFCQWMKIHSI